MKTALCKLLLPDGALLFFNDLPSPFGIKSLFFMENHIFGGATIWARQTIESEIFYWKPDKWFKIWFYIVNKVNHKDNRLFKRGENFFCFKKEEPLVRCSRDQWTKCLRFLKSSQMISTSRSTRGIVIKVPKYSFYQDLNNYETQEKAQTEHIRDASEAHQKHIKSPTINKNDKNDKNDKNPPTPQRGMDEEIYFKTFEKFFKWVKGMSQIKKPKEYTKTIFKKYPVLMIDKALKQSTSLNKFSEEIENYLNKKKLPLFKEPK